MKSIIDNWNKYTEEILNESSFSRMKRMVDEGKQPFIVISAARGDLGEGDAGNQKRGKMLKRDLKEAGYPFTQVLGAGQEEPVEDPDTNEMSIKRVLEVTQIVTTHQRGDVPREKSEDETAALFDLGRNLSSKYDQFAFIFGYPVEDKFGNTVMAIAAYDADAPSYGMQHRIKDDWAGPWHTIRQTIESDQYWTKIAGTKGVFIEDKIRELEEMDTGHYVQKGWKTSQILKWKSLL
tara:strand:- start:1161 stop:1868 length:708 start_codon:yes stop_codon:yes gene_type:complete